MQKKIILASQSPRRNELMKSAGFIFEAIPAKVEEIIPDNATPEQTVISIARQKAEEIISSHPDCIVIGADTIVVIDNNKEVNGGNTSSTKDTIIILGKPKDKAEAFNMLRSLSGKTHAVFTGVVILGLMGREGKTDIICEKTEVEFHELSDQEINDYICTGEPFDKAGAYGIQGKGMLLVKKIKGDFYNVMGLPISKVTRYLRLYNRFEEGSPHQCNVNKSYNITDLLEIMALLRSEKGCPWDREQNHDSIRSNVIEEAYEVVEAIDRIAAVDSPCSDGKFSTSEELCEELGDLLLQVVFHGQIAKEAGDFDFDDICDVICKKLVYRHPHVFGDIDINSTDDVIRSWDNLKSNSKGEQTATERLDSVPKLLPALMRGEKVGKRAAHTGFDFDNVNEILDCLKNGINELETVINSNFVDLHQKESLIEEEIGDILYSCCSLGRFLKKDCEKALTISINRFIMRFRRFEDMVLKSGKKIEDLNKCQLGELWQATKKLVNNSQIHP